MTRPLIIAIFALSLLSLAPSALAVPVNQACTADLGEGVCKPASGGNSVCSQSNILGGGNCDGGLICCGAAGQCANEAQDPVPCDAIAGNYGLATNLTVGMAQWTAWSCDLSDQSKWKYVGGCSAPTTSSACSPQNPTGTCPTGSTCTKNGACVSNSGGGCSPQNPTGTCPTGSTCTKNGACVQSGSGGQNITLINPLKGGATVQSFLDGILKFVIYLGSIVVIFMLVYVGFLFVVARGEPAKLTTARQALLWTVIGALILLGAVAIKDGIFATVNALSAGQ